MGSEKPRRFRLRIFSRKGAIRLALIFALLFAAGCYMIDMPGRSYEGPLPALSAEDVQRRDSLRRDVEMLATDIGMRNFAIHPQLMKAADAVEARLRSTGLAVERQTFEIGTQAFHNIEARIPGSEEIVIVGAHYDTAIGTPGANDNATGVAALIALAHAFAREKPQRTLRFVAFTNEELPHFMTPKMGSWVYAKRCRERKEHVVAMVSLETLGYYSDREGSQNYPPPLSFFYPSTGNFVAFVGNLGSRSLVHESIACFHESAQFPAQGAALPGWMPGVGWSDHASFWEHGYPGIMVTDTAPFRYPHYHSAQDTPDKIDFDRFTRVVTGLEKVVRKLARVTPP